MICSFGHTCQAPVRGVTSKWLFNQALLHFRFFFWKDGGFPRGGERGLTASVAGTIGEGVWSYGTGSF